VAELKPSPLTASPWWTPERHADRRPFLLARGAIKRALRGWFEEQGFVETEVSALAVSPGNEAHLHAFATEAMTLEGGGATLYLHTSPEFAAKKLLAAGEIQIFEFARVWRNRERGPLHSPEFTMLEWYRSGAPYEALMDDCAALLGLAAGATGAQTFAFRDGACDPFAEPQRITVAEAFERYAGVDLFGDLAAQAAARGLRVAADDRWADVFSRIIAEIEPQLGFGRPTILCEYPVSEAALARPKPGDPRVAERFELYVCGVELANAFGELTDAGEQRRRFELEMAEKARIYGDAYPLDEDFLSALAQMPPASGAALGFDRLAMLASGATHIDQVLWSPVP
jgi:lysyl-tRNA synthetase class 2